MARGVDSELSVAITGLPFHNGHGSGWLIYAKIKGQLMSLSLIFKHGINLFRSNYDDRENGLRPRTLGKLIYSFDVQMPDGIHEVNVDAYSGKILEDHIESPADEAKEKAQEKKD